MTMWCPTLEGDTALLAQLRGDPRSTEVDVPSPRSQARMVEGIQALADHGREASEPTP